MPQAAMRTSASRGPGSGSGTSSRRQSSAPCNMICFIGWSPRGGGSGTGAVEHHADEAIDPGVVDAVGRAAEGGMENRSVDEGGEHRRIDVGPQLTLGLGATEAVGREPDGDGGV